MIGSAPRLPEYQQLFDWPDSLIEIPTDPIDMPAFYADLQAQPERLRQARILNATQSLRRHDWAYRIEEILRMMDLPVPSSLTGRKARLVQLAERGEAELRHGLAAQ